MKKLLLILSIVLPALSFAQNTDKEEKLKQLGIRLQSSDATAQNWSSMKPEMNDFQNLFRSVQDVGDVWMYTETEYMDLVDKGIQIDPSYTIVEVKSVLAAELSPAETHGFHAEYGNINNRIKPNVRLYMLTYKPDDKKSTEEQKVDVFFHTNNKWVFIPSAYKAFE